MKRSRHGAAAICAVWLLASFAAPALLVSDGLFLVLLLTGMLFVGVALWAAVPVVLLVLALRRLGQRRVGAALALLLVPVLGVALGYGGGQFWWALHSATLPPNRSCTLDSAGVWHCPHRAQPADRLIAALFR